MNDKAQELFLKNYNNQGLCEGLPKFVKKIIKEFKKSNTTKEIDYLPWATVERLFRLQGGKIEIKEFKFEVPFTINDYNADTGEIEKGEKSALFMHLVGTWQGETLDEYYPIFDSQNSRVIRTPDAQDLNNSRQRGSVRLIARLSGIGLWIFEQQEDGEGDGGEEVGNEKPNVIKAQTKEEKKEKVKKKKDESLASVTETEEDLVKDKEEADEIQDEENVANMFLGKEVKEKEPLKADDLPNVEDYAEQKSYDIGTEEHADKLLELKGWVSKDTKYRDRIIEFRNQVGKSLLGKLSYNEIVEIIGILEKM